MRQITLHASSKQSEVFCSLPMRRVINCKVLLKRCTAAWTSFISFYSGRLTRTCWRMFYSYQLFHVASYKWQDIDGSWRQQTSEYNQSLSSVSVLMHSLPFKSTCLWWRQTFRIHSWLITWKISFVIASLSSVADDTTLTNLILV